MAHGRTLEEIMNERPARPIRATLGEIMSDTPDRPIGDDEGEIPTDEPALEAKLKAWDAELARIKNELFARKLAVKPVGERDLAAAHEHDLNRQLGRMMVVRDEIAGRLQRCVNLRNADRAVRLGDDGLSAATGLQKLYAIRDAVNNGRSEPICKGVRDDLARTIDRLEDDYRRATMFKLLR